MLADPPPHYWGRILTRATAQRPTIDVLDAPAARFLLTIPFCPRGMPCPCRSFQGFTCLLQLSSRTTDYVVDGLALRGCLGRALAPLMADPGVLKVGADGGRAGGTCGSTERSGQLQARVGMEEHQVPRAGCDRRELMPGRGGADVSLLVAEPPGHGTVGGEVR